MTVSILKTSVVFSVRNILGAKWPGNAEFSFYGVYQRFPANLIVLRYFRTIFPGKTDLTPIKDTPGLVSFRGLDQIFRRTSRSLTYVGFPPWGKGTFLQRINEA